MESTVYLFANYDWISLFRLSDKLYRLVICESMGPGMGWAL